MTILDNVYTEPLRTRRVQPSSRPRLEWYMEEGNQIPFHNGYTYENSYRTELRVISDWWANNAQYEGRRRMQEEMILHTLYDPVLTKLRYIMSAAMDRDFEAVLETCSEIEKEILGER